ncbi:MAG: hypothetical protein ABIN97_12515, partial [Ginsengibacter sp.]
MPIFSLGVYLFAFYTVYRYFKNAPKIQVDNDLISFNKETFAWTDLKKIELTGKRSFQYLIDFPMEAATLQFNDGQIKYIFDDMYENSWEIKSFLKQVIIDKKTFIKTDNQSIDPVYINTDFYEIFKGNQFTSLRGISLWGLVGFFVYMILTNEKIPTFGLLVFFTIFSLFWFLGHSWLMHYFKVSTNILVVKNHNLTWRSKAYRLNDIKEIVFETQGKMPNCLRV